MIDTFLQVILPVFIIVTVGYLTVKLNILSSMAINGLLKLTTNIAIPVFLFLSILKLDLFSIFNWKLLLSYYIGAISCFILGFVVSKKYLFCSTSEATAISFCILFANAVLLGLPLTALAYGEISIGSNLAIISVNAPICYLIGISVMELANKKKILLKKQRLQFSKQ